jgi:hypothetical protein
MKKYIVWAKRIVDGWDEVWDIAVETDHIGEAVAVWEALGEHQEGILTRVLREEEDAIAV